MAVNEPSPRFVWHRAITITYSEPLLPILYYMHVFMILNNGLNLNLIRNTTTRCSSICTFMQ